MKLLLFGRFIVRLFLQSFLVALGQIWTRKMRSFLTTLGIIIGVTGVTGVIAALSGLKAKVLSDFEQLGTNKIFIGADVPRVDGRRVGPYRDFESKDFDQILNHCSSLKTFTRVGWSTQKVRNGSFMEENVPVVGIEPAWHEIENRALLSGRPFTAVDMTDAKYVCIINPAVQFKLNLDRDCIGRPVLVGDRRYTVVGVVELQPTGGMFGMGRSNLEIYVPFTTANRARKQGFGVTAAAKSTEVSEEAQAEVRYYLRRVRGIKPGEPENFRVEAVSRFLQAFRKTSTIITIVAVGIVGISLIVGGVGIMNIMLVSVSERTREIGLRKALGAGPAVILLQFLVEAVTLCLVGGVFGLAGGFAIAELFKKIPGAELDKAFVPLWAIVLAFSFSGSVGVIFGMFPALKAAALNPIDALRHE